MINLSHEASPGFKENILACGIKKNHVILPLWQTNEMLKEIDKWIDENIESRIYYTETWSQDASVCQQHFYFSDTEDLMAFKLRWV